MVVDGDGEVTDFLRLPHIMKRRNGWNRDDADLKVTTCRGLVVLYQHARVLYLPTCQGLVVLYQHARVLYLPTCQGLVVLYQHARVLLYFTNMPNEYEYLP